MKHEKTKMQFKDSVRRRFQIGGTSGGRFRSYWLRVFECPRCGARKYPLSNASKGKEFFCWGS